jgi:hypothetical protein
MRDTCSLGHNNWRMGRYCITCTSIRNMRRCRDHTYIRYYSLNLVAYKKAKKGRRNKVIAELSGMTLNTFMEYLYHNVRAPEEKAKLIAETLKVPFESLWTKA